MRDELLRSAPGSVLANEQSVVEAGEGQDVREILERIVWQFLKVRQLEDRSRGDSKHVAIGCGGLSHGGCCQGG